MGLQELTPFLREAVTHIHEIALFNCAWQAAGKYGKQGTIYERFTELAKTDEDRKALADLMFACVSNAIIHAVWFVEERVTLNQMSVVVSDGARPQRVEGSDMLQGWFGMIRDDCSTVTPETILEEIKRVSSGGEMTPYPATTDFPPIRDEE